MVVIDVAAGLVIVVERADHLIVDQLHAKLANDIAQRHEWDFASGGGTAVDVACGFGVSSFEVSGLVGEEAVASATGEHDGAAPCSSSQLCSVSPQLHPNFRSIRIGTRSLMASTPSCATISACSRVDTEHSSASCICKSGTMPSRQQARIHSLVCRAAEPWISALSALRVSARQSGPLPNHG